MKRAKYTEPTDYFPKELRKKHKIGEYAEDEAEKTDKKNDENKAFRDYVNGND